LNIGDDIAGIFSFRRQDLVALLKVKSVKCHHPCRCCIFYKGNFTSLAIDKLCDCIIGAFNCRIGTGMSFIAAHFHFEIKVINYRLINRLRHK